MRSEERGARTRRRMRLRRREERYVMYRFSLRNEDRYICMRENEERLRVRRGRVKKTDVERFVFSFFV